MSRVLFAVLLFGIFLGLNMRTVAGPIVIAVSVGLMIAAIWRAGHRRRVQP